MKLDKIKFAKVIAFIIEANRSGFDDDAIETLDRMIDIDVEPVKTGLVEASYVDELLKQIISPDGFIPAIKAYRSLTGAGLKEAKEAVERYRILPNFRHKVPVADSELMVNQKPATLGDILGKATARNPPVNFDKFEG